MTALLLVDRSSGRTFVHFTLESVNDEVSVVGSFNDWVPGVHVLAPQHDGSRSVQVEVEHPGDVHFRYLAAGGRWFDDSSAHVINEYGSTLYRDAARETDVPGIEKVAAKKVAAKKVAAKKVAAKKVAKVAAKKVAAKKVAAKKVAAKKVAAKKVAAKKVAAKKVAAKKVAAKKVAKEVAVKKVAAKKVAVKNVAAKKATKKARTERS